MAAVRVSKNQIVCVSSDHIIALPIGGTDCHVYQNEKSELLREKGSQPTGAEEGSLKILACQFSKSGRYFVTCDDYKQLSLWSIHNDNTWSRLSTRSSFRRATSVTFTDDESAVLVGDKSGDVYTFSVDEHNTDGQPSMGHVSMLLDLVLLSKDRLLATCDRDEKIRISYYPNTYSIYSYCLGHTDFVSQLIYLEEEDVIVSGSGDGTLRAWNYHDGQQLSITDCRTHLDHHSDNPDHSSEIQTEDRENGDRPSSQDSVQKRGQNDQGIDLKCLVHCQQEKLIVVGFERLQLLLVYKYVCQSSDELSIALTFRQKLLLSGDFWDMTFDTKGHLWVLQAYKDKPLEVFQTNSSDDQLVPLEAAGDKHNFLPTLTAVSQKWHLLKDCGGGDGLFSVLHKIKVDNAQFYRERKHQRLEEQKRRHKAKKERKQTPKEVSTSSESLVHHQTKPSILATSGDWKGDLPECKKTKLDG